MLSIGVNINSLRSRVSPIALWNAATALGDYTTLSTLSSMPTGGVITRAGNATMFDSTGRLTYAPNNLLLQSNNISTGSPWNAIGAPAGSVSGSTLTFVGGAGNDWFYQGVSAPVGANVILSITLTAGTKSRIVLRDASGASSVVANLTATPTQFFVRGTVAAGGIVSFGLDNRVSVGGDGIAGTVIYSNAVLSLVTYETTPRAADQVITTSSAYYGPRFDYDPSTLASRGLLIEGARTNVFQQSNNFTTWWSTLNASVTSAQATGPDGLQSMTLWTATGSGEVRILAGTNFTTPSTAYTTSIVAKYGNANGRYLWFRDFYANKDTCFDTLNGIAVTVPSGVTTSVQNLGNGLYRYSVTTTEPASAQITDSQLFTLSSSSSSPSSGLTGGTMYVGFVQREVGSYPTSYIPTTSSTVTRAAESFAISGYSSQMIMATYIDEATGATYNTPYNAGVAPSPSNAWITSLRVYNGATPGTQALPSFLSHSRAGNAMMYDSTGRLTYAPNNLLTFSNDFANAVWAKAASGTGVAPVITPNAGVAPNGELAASRVQFNRGAGTSVNDVSSIRNSTLPSVVGLTALSSIWVRSFDGVSSYDMSVIGLDNGSTPVTVSGTWTRILAPKGVIAANAASGLRLVGTSANQTADVLLWGAQLELVTYETSPRAYNATTSAAYFGPRFDFDPATLAPRGLLIEGARTNLALQSETFGASWTLVGTTVTNNTTASPNGTTNADTFNASAGTGSHYITQNFTWSAAAHTVSLFVRQGTNRFIQITTWDGTTSRFANFDLQAGTLGTTSAGTTSTITPIQGGWFRISLSATMVAATGNITIAFATSSSSGPNLSFTATGTETVFIWGAQVEVGSYPTSYIPTTSATVTRATDVVTLTGAARAAFTDRVAASVVVEAQLQGITNIGRLIGFNTAVTPIYAQTDTELRHYSTIATPFVIAAFPQTGSFTGGPIRVGGAGSANTRRIVMGGGAVVSDGNSFFGPPISVVSLGNQSGASPADGWYTRLAIWNTVLSDATLKAKTVLGAPL